MNEPTLTQLKVLVERAVRPVEVSNYRKQKMREELLAHVTAVFEEEAAHLGDDRLAVERTAQRFGNPAELTGQLQDSVPGRDRWDQLMEHLFVGAGMPTLRLAFHYTAFSLVPATILLVAFFVQGRMAEWPIALAGPVLAFLSVILVKGMHDALFGRKGRSWRKAALIGIASWFLVPCVTFAVCLTFSGEWRSSMTSVLPLLWLAPLAAVVLIICAYAFAMQARAQREWAELRID